jgi:8-oxo-dGTP pyrophosphatase MutT (NUDIX family)
MSTISMEFDDFVLALEKRLQQNLPGKPAQLKMSSLARIRELIKLAPSHDAVLSSVLILLYPYAGKIRLVLMLRPEYPGVHSGQISLPGGKSEDSDESVVFTALREAQEEIGIDPGSVQIIGRLTEMYIPPSNFIVTPVVGFQTRRPDFHADPKEVARIIEIDLDDLLDKENIKTKKIKLRPGFALKVPSYFIDGNIIWGATAMILSEFREISKEIIEAEGGMVGK